MASPVKKHGVMMIAEDLPCGGKTLKAQLPAGKMCLAKTLLGLFGKQFNLDAASLALKTSSGEYLADAAKVVFDDELSVFTVVALPKAKPLSAHATIAMFQGVEDGVATFAIDRYLRYAAIVPGRCEPRQERFEVVVAHADTQTAALADETTATLSAVVDSLSVGDRVELEWLQLVAPGSPERVLRQTQKLNVIDETEEAALVAQFPEPQIMTPKDGSPCAPPLCRPCAPPASESG